MQPPLPHRRPRPAPRPIPGTTAPPRALFVGRWGALLARPPGAAPGARFDPALVSSGATAMLFRACQAGWSVYLIGNEEAVARGRVSDAAWQRFQADLVGWLAGQGVPVVRDYACLDHPEGKGGHRQDSVFLFPNTGALYHAAQEDGIELGESWIVSADALELAAGWRAGCRLVRIGSSPRASAGELEVEAEGCARDLASAMRELLAGGATSRRR